MSKVTFGLIAAAGAATGAVCTAAFLSSRKPAPAPVQPPVPAGIAASLARQKLERQPSQLVNPAGLFQYGMFVPPRFSERASFSAPLPQLQIRAADGQFAWNRLSRPSERPRDATCPHLQF